MRDWRRLARAGGTVASASVLGGCSGETGPWLFAGLALAISAGAAAGVGWLLGRHSARRALHEARQQARLLGTLAGGSLWRTRGQPPRLDDGRRFAEVYELGARMAAIEARLGRDEPFGPLVLARQGGGGTQELRALPWLEDDGGFGGQFGLARPLEADEVQGQALRALVEAWPEAVAALARRHDDEPWHLLQASSEARRTLGSAGSFEAATLRERLPESLHGTLASPGEADGGGWRLRHLHAGHSSLLLMWRPAGQDDDDTASLVYAVAHDLRAPIRVVDGFTRILKEDYGPALDRVANDHLDRVLGATARMNQMIDAVLALARLSTQPLARQPVNLSQLAGFVVDDLRRSAPERDAVIQIEPELQTVGDPTLLRLVLENLLGNAWKYTGKRPQTHIVFGREPVDGRSAYVVRDNGAGFDMRSAERLFGLFQRLHSASDFQGTGVGLASVQRIVRRHGGEIWADGEPGRGAAFFFTLRE